jgi:putative transferase (TIGR04331 family)
MGKYLQDKAVFLQSLSANKEIKVFYRPHASDHGWGERESVKRARADIEFATSGKLVYWMKKVRLVVIDHPSTSFLEALTINIPSIFYWDREVWAMRGEAEVSFDALRAAGILHNDPQGAASKVKEIYSDPSAWWLGEGVQKVRRDFCGQFAYSRKDWLKVWIRELDSV